MEKIVLPSVTLFLTIGMLNTAGVMSPETTLKIIGYVSLSWSMVYYLAPLSAILVIIRSRNASSLILPTIIMNVASSGMWFGYGLAIDDPNLYIPMLTGLLLSCCQLLVKWYYNVPSIKSNSVAISNISDHGENEMPLSSLRYKSPREGEVNDSSTDIMTPTSSDFGIRNRIPGGVSGLESEADNVVTPFHESGMSEMQTMGITTEGHDADTSHHPVSVVADAFAGALSEVLAPFKPQLSVRTIRETEANEVQKTEEVTFVGVVTDIIAPIFHPVLAAVTENSPDVEEGGSYRAVVPSLSIPRAEGGYVPASVGASDQGRDGMGLHSYRSSPDSEEYEEQVYHS
jgi:hypothetical protein